VLLSLSTLSTVQVLSESGLQPCNQIRAWDSLICQHGWDNLWALEARMRHDWCKLWLHVCTWLVPDMMIFAFLTQSGSCVLGNSYK
jgi:hypothetical protein